MQRSHKVGQNAVAESSSESDGNRATIAFGDPAGGGRRLFRETQDASRVGKERLSGCCQAYDSIRPLEQRRTNLMLE